MWLEDCTLPSAMRVLLATPPMTQLNTPYPATAYLTGFLRARGQDVRQADPAIELVLRLLSRHGLERVRAALPKTSLSASVRHFNQNFSRIAEVADPVIR